MKRLLEFLKQNPLVVKWTAWYFFALWFVLRFVFKFDMFSGQYWWKFIHGHFHGFWGLVFCIIVYTAFPIYIATVLTVYRKKELIITIPLLDKIPIISKLFTQKTKEAPTEPDTQIEENEKSNEPDLPPDLPPELRVPYTRARNHLPFANGTSIYNQRPVVAAKAQPTETENPAIPIPMDFDISDTIDQDMDDSVPNFTDINFDTPIATEKELENKTTKYFKSHDIEFETYKEFVATEKYVIYEHNDEDFWIMDGESWFAAGKQIDSPVPELLGLARQNNLTPVLYLASQNIMDFENIVKQFSDAGIRVITKLEELN